MNPVTITISADCDRKYVMYLDDDGVTNFLPFFPTPSPLTRAIFCAAFAPKEHGNACFAGYT